MNDEHINEGRRKIVYGNEGNHQEKEEANREESREGTGANMLNLKDTLVRQCFK